MFYLIQYSISNLNAFILIITIGYSLYCYTQNDKYSPILEPIHDKEEIVKEEMGKKEYIKEEKDKDSNNTDAINSPIQLIDQLKGYFIAW
ncbi:predicted protein [Plenodomus lingam JN3]|uniref:Predicted protein n=1 Tax=Leptosphaeria maculans (strain JN3 / isolate v23.1.3 / race Av1-4-5-6-7-8) TaxID=985895 RepID=E4ZQ84_LEPMJ|nr:predicted protein [Plenodomus lingam JN3]CBX89994.1 predicted protein [Plenodomus lingam JN3]